MLAVVKGAPGVPNTTGNYPVFRLYVGGHKIAHPPPNKHKPIDLSWKLMVKTILAAGLKYIVEWDISYAVILEYIIMFIYVYLA